ncbi:MAG: hypothetical protein R3C58_00360 [Parvularculaceae bacterium]
MIRFFAAALSILFAATGPAAAEGPDALLAALEGRWRAEGTVEGETVAYDAEGRFTLGGAFLRFDMIEAVDAPTYEANIYLARAPKGDYVAHWMDVFGADGARVVGEGVNESGRLVILFP